jgi:hypothetical protein
MKLILNLLFIENCMFYTKAAIVVVDGLIDNTLHAQVFLIGRGGTERRDLSEYLKCQP